MDEPYIPFYKPYGMSDEEYQEEVRIAQQKHDEWEWYETQQWEEQWRWEQEQDRLRDLYTYDEDGFCDGFTKY